MSRQAAISAVRASSADANHKNRAEALLNNPEAINQSFWGICGMASIIKVVLEHEPEKFADLFKSILCGTQFASPGLGNIPANGVKNKLDAQFEKKRQVSQGLRPQHPLETDFMLARGMMTMLENIAGIDGVFAHALDFCTDFGKVWNDLDQGKQGDLALDIEHLDILINGFFGTQKTVNVHPKEVKGPGFDKSHLDVNECLAGKVGAKPFVLAGVNDFGTLAAGNDVSKEYKRKDGEPAKFTHWVLIRDTITVSGAYYVIPTWSWASQQTVRVHRNVVDQYFYVLLYGSL